MARTAALTPNRPLFVVFEESPDLVTAGVAMDTFFFSPFIRSALSSPFLLEYAFFFSVVSTPMDLAPLNSTWLLSGSVSVSDVSAVVGSVYMDVEAVAEVCSPWPPKLHAERPNTTEAAVEIANNLINICLFIMIPLDTNH